MGRSMQRLVVVTILISSCGVGSVGALRSGDTVLRSTQQGGVEVLTLEIDVSNFTSNETPSDFAGFSYEVNCAPRMMGTKRGSGFPCDYPPCPANNSHAPHIGPWPQRESFANLMNVLKTAANGTRGPNIRIGGASSDRTWYTEFPVRDFNRPFHPGDWNKVTPQDIGTYNYAAAWNGTVTIGLNIQEPYNYTNTVKYASVVTQMVATELIQGFELGNEPEHFTPSFYPKKQWSYQVYNELFGRYAKSLAGFGRMKMPWIQGAVFADNDWSGYVEPYVREWGPPTTTTTAPRAKSSTNGGREGLETGAAQQQGQNYLRSISVHYYPMGPINATIEKLMNRTAASNVAKYWRERASFTVAQGLPFVIGEGNSNFGVAPGVADTFASALWAIDVMAYSATANISRWNFHGCPASVFAPVVIHNVSAVARPIFYGMWFFSRLTSNGARFVRSSLVTSTVPKVVSGAASPTGREFREEVKGEEEGSLPDWVSAWATVDRHNRLRVALLNKNPVGTKGSTSAPRSTTSSNSSSGGNVTVTLNLGENYGGSREGKMFFLAPTSSSGRDRNQGLSELWDVTFGGKTLKGVLDGVPVGSEESWPVQISINGTLRIKLPLATAILLEF